MVGNVWQWMADCFPNQPEQLGRHDPTGYAAGCVTPSIRGGAAPNQLALCKPTFRVNYWWRGAAEMIGFRVVRLDIGQGRNSVSVPGAMWRAIGATFLCAILVLSAAPARAQDLIIYSQNLLRFGHGSRTATQCAAVGAHIPDVDIILIQELMVATTPCANVNLIPGTYVWNAPGPYGRSSYKEYYGFLYSSTPRANGPRIVFTTVTGSAGNTTVYMRPPQGLLFQVFPFDSSTNLPSTTGKYLWVANAHLIWGGSNPGQRRAEATNVALFFTAMQAVQNPTAGTAWTTNVLIGGDWNLAATDTGFNALTTAGATIQPNVKTSLNPAGALSQPYDHFITSGTVTLSNITTFQGAGSLPTWRTTVSTILASRLG